MKILILNPLPYLYAYAGSTGAQRALAEGLVADGHQVTVITTQIGIEDDERGLLIPCNKPHAQGGHWERNGVEIFAIESLEFALSAKQMHAVFTSEIERFAPDCVVVSDDFLDALESGVPPTLGAWLETLSGIMSPQKITYICHAAAMLPFGPQGFDVGQSSVSRLALFNSLAGIVTVSHHLADYIGEYLEARPTVIPFPAYGSGPFNDCASFDRKIVGVINPSEIKGLSVFCGVAQSLPDSSFVAVPTWASNEAVLEKLRALDNVTIAEPTHDKDELFSCMSCLLVPSLWYEAWGLVVVEAMLRGIPVIAADSGGLIEAKLGVDFLCPVNPIESYLQVADKEGTPEAIIPEQPLGPWIEAVRTLLSSRSEYERVSNDGKKAATEFVAGLGASAFADYFAAAVAK